MTIGDSNTTAANDVPSISTVTSGTAYTFTIPVSSPSAIVDAGTTKKYNVYATLGGSPTLPNYSTNIVNTQFAKANFVWQETVSGSTNRKCFWFNYNRLKLILTL